MITEIFIENQRLDLSSDISSDYTYSIDDIQDFAARNTSFSKTIILPGNANNNKLFGHIFEFTSANFYNPANDNVGYNFNAAKSASCVIYVDKIQIFKGIIRLLEITIDRGTIEYECVVFGELGGLVTALANKKIEELDFSAYDHVWNRANIVNSWNQASGTTASGMGYYYPLIDYGQVSDGSTKKDWEIGAFRPALFVREYIDKIITGAGYTWDCGFFDSDLFKRLVIPNNQKYLSNYSDISFQADFENIQRSHSGSPTPRPLLSVFDILNAGYFTANLALNRFTYTGPTSLTIAFEWDIIGETSDYTDITVLKNGTPTSASVYFDYQFTIENYQTTYITLNTNDYIEFRLGWAGWNTGGGLTMSTSLFNVKAKTSSAIAVPLILDDQVFLNNSIPRGIFQRDFFSSIVKMFNLYVVEDYSKEKHLLISPYIDFYPALISLPPSNWTNIVDRSKPFKIKPMSELNGRYFEFRYKPDSDFYNDDYAKKYAQGYGDYIEDTGYEFAVDRQTAEVIFSATPLVGYAEEDKVFPTIFKLTNTQNAQSEDPIESNIRIMQVHRVDGVASWHIRHNSGNLGTALTSYGYAGHLNDPDAPTSDINFGAPKEIYFNLATAYPTANLFNGFWSDYVAEITDKDSILLTCNVYLRNTDIYNLDFSRLIYIDGALWRLNKVIDYNPINLDTTKCELLKVIELTYA